MFSIKGREDQSSDHHLSTCGIHSGSDRFRVWPPVHIEVEVGKLAHQVTLQISMQLSQKPVHRDTNAQLPRLPNLPIPTIASAFSSFL